MEQKRTKQIHGELSGREKKRIVEIVREQNGIEEEKTNTQGIEWKREEENGGDGEGTAWNRREKTNTRGIEWNRREINKYTEN